MSKGSDPSKQSMSARCNSAIRVNQWSSISSSKSKRVFIILQSFHTPISYIMRPTSPHCSSHILPLLSVSSTTLTLALFQSFNSYLSQTRRVANPNNPTVITQGRRAIQRHRTSCRPCLYLPMSCVALAPWRPSSRSSSSPFGPWLSS